GVRQNVTINQILQANGARMPDSTTAPKSFRAAVVMLTRQGTQPTPATLDKVTRYRLAWEIYFGQSTDFLGAISTGLADQTVPRTIAAVSAASYQPTLGAGEISALYGAGLTSGGVASSTFPPPPPPPARTHGPINGGPPPPLFPFPPP